MQNKRLAEEQKEHQLSLEAQDKCKLWLKDRNLAREKEQARRRREAVSERLCVNSNKGKTWQSTCFACSETYSGWFFSDSYFFKDQFLKSE